MKGALSFSRVFFVLQILCPNHEPLGLEKKKKNHFTLVNLLTQGFSKKFRIQQLVEKDCIESINYPFFISEMNSIFFATVNEIIYHG